MSQPGKSRLEAVEGHAAWQQLVGGVDPMMKGVSLPKKQPMREDRAGMVGTVRGL